jgi:hypothetical protein
MRVEAVQEFKALVFNRYGIALSDAEALEQASHLLQLYKIVYDSAAGAPDTDGAG